MTLGIFFSKNLVCREGNAINVSSLKLKGITVLQKYLFQLFGILLEVKQEEKN